MQNDNNIFDVLDEVCFPKRATKHSAFVDLFSREDVEINAGTSKVIKLGIKLNLDKLRFEWNELAEDKEWEQFLQSHYLEIAIRSSLALRGLIIANGTGKVDLDYPDEIGIILHNPIKWIKPVYKAEHIETLIDEKVDDITYGETFFIKKGEKIAQSTIVPHLGYLMGIKSNTTRIGGFGSTGTI